MDSVSIIKPGEIKISRIKESDLSPGKKEVLVEVNTVSLCGSDYRLFNGTYGGPSVYPILFGHEWSGKVAATGSGVTSVKKGNRVTGDCSCWCGDCPNCAGDKNLCYNIEKFGITKDGFSQQFAVVPEKYLYVAPSSISYEVLALSECFAVALRAIYRLRDNSQQPSPGRILIIGSGPLGMAIFILLKKLYNWEGLEIYDILPERVAHLRKLFPGDTIGHSIDENKILRNSGKDSYKDLYASGDYSLIFEAAGKLEALQMAVNLARPRGTIVNLGIFPPGIVDFNKIVMKSLSIIGSIGGTGEFQTVIKFFEKHSSLIDSLVTARFFYKDTAKAFAAGQDQKRHVKVQIQFTNR